jgi:hypothetical protein
MLSFSCNDIPFMAPLADTDLSIVGSSNPKYFDLQFFPLNLRIVLLTYNYQMEDKNRDFK